MRNSDCSTDGCSSDLLGARSLRLQQERGEIGGLQRMADRAQNLAAICFDDGGGVALQRMTEGVIRGDEEPGVAAGGADRLRSAVRRVGKAGVSTCRSWGWPSQTNTKQHT